MADGTRRKKIGFIPVPAPKGNPPVCVVVPVATGNVTLGTLLSTTTGTWLRSPNTFYYQWQRNNVDIPGAIYPTYTVTNADLGNSIHCLVTAWNNDGPGYAYSNDLGAGVIGGFLGKFDFTDKNQTVLIAILEDI